MRNFAHDMLHDSPSAQRIIDLWNVSSVNVGSFSFHPTSLSMSRNMKLAKRMKLNLSKVSDSVFKVSSNVLTMISTDLDRLEMALQGRSSQKPGLSHI
jgi:hypothetical protein